MHLLSTTYGRYLEVHKFIIWVIQLCIFSSTIISKNRKLVCSSVQHLDVQQIELALFLCIFFSHWIAQYCNVALQCCTQTIAQHLSSTIALHCSRTIALHCWFATSHLVAEAPYSMCMCCTEEHLVGVWSPAGTDGCGWRHRKCESPRHQASNKF